MFNFDNKCINCSSVEKCKMLYDTKLGKLIQSLEVN